MSEAAWIALLGGLLGGGGAVTAVLTFWQQHRLSDGTVRNTPAERLWEAVNAARDSAERRMERLEREIADLRAQVAVKDQELFDLRVKVKFYEERIEELEYQLAQIESTAVQE